MQQHVPDTGNTYILITPSDIKDLRFAMLISGAAGLVAAVGLAYWWEANEDDRKHARQQRKQKKVAKEVDRVMKKTRKKAQKIRERRA